MGGGVKKSWCQHTPPFRLNSLRGRVHRGVFNMCTTGLGEIRGLYVVVTFFVLTVGCQLYGASVGIRTCAPRLRYRPSH